MKSLSLFLLFALTASLGVGFAQSQEVPNAARKAIARRQQMMEDGRQTLLRADRLFADQRYGEALVDYRSVFVSTPAYGAAGGIRQESFAKYQEALRFHADELSKGGKRREAQDAVQRFFQDARNSGMPPSAVQEKTKLLMADLRDPEMYNPALTEDHVARVAKAEEWLKTADGALATGQYDKATKFYAQVLGVDPHNRAARRGMEKVDRQMNLYYESAYDHTRAKMLGDVTAQWENPVPRYSIELPDLEPLPSSSLNDSASVAVKLQTIQIPEVNFAETPLREALAYLVVRSKQLDPSGQGVNMILQSTDPSLAETPVTMSLRGVPLRSVLDYLTQVAGVDYRVENYAVSIVPAGTLSGTDLVMKSFRVPPSFLSEGALTQESDPFASDPFGGDAGGGSSTLQPKLSAQEFLERNGISFPPGAIAKFVPATSTLIVRNTADQVNLIETLVENSFGDVSKMVKVEVRILEIDEENLTEIGFDWLLSPFNLDSDSILTGGTAGNTSPGNLNDYPAVPVGNPITSGLRTGDLAQARDGIDDLLLEGGGGAIPPTARAPGIFSINGNLTSPNFQGVLRMVAQRSGRDLMTATSVVTRSGQLGSVRNVREFIYPTEYDPPEIPDQVGFAVGPANGTAAGFPVTPANPAAFETREIGAALEVEPLLDGDGVTVLLNLSPEFTFFQGFVNYGSPINTVGADPPVALTDNRILMPVFRTLRNTTSVNVYDGETVVLGGLLTEAVSHVQDKVPLLGDAPLVGHLFRSESESRRKKAVIFFVTPTIIDPAGVPLRTREPAQVSLNTPEG